MADELSYFSSLESPQTRVRVTPTYQPPELKSPATNATNTSDNINPTSESDADSNSNSDQSSRALQADKFSLSSEAEQITAEDLRLIQKLAQRDREVKAHEAAHLAAAGRYANSGASFTYQRGPNGVNYAIGGEVSLDTSTPSDPRQALDKANQIRAAALAPSQPSGQDRAVAAQATQAAAQARANIAIERAETTAAALERTQGDDAESNPQGTDETENVSAGDSETTPQAQSGIQEYRNNSTNNPDTIDRNPSFSLEA